MLGWWIVVAQQTPEQRDACTDRDEGVLASWEVGLSGNAWLATLVKMGKAKQIAFSGYPNRYVSTASAVLPLIANGPPTHTGPEVIGDDYVIPANWAGQAKIDKPKLLACPPQQTLTIDVWDQS